MVRNTARGRRVRSLRGYAIVAMSAMVTMNSSDAVARIALV
ncbi:MAG: hypothetical protein ACYC0I_04865 [Acidimicrobiales bacterium]